MKLDNISRSLWSAVLVLIITAGSNSNTLVSAAPVATLSSGSDAPNPTARTAIQADRPGSYSTQVDHPVVTQVVHWRQGEGDDDIRHWLDPVLECYVDAQDVKICNRAKSGVETIEEDEDSDTEGDVELSKRRMQVYGAIRYVNPADIRKRDCHSSASAIIPEEEFEVGVALSKRRMRKSGQIQTVHPDDYMKRGLLSATATPVDEPEFESESESADECVDEVDLSKRREMSDSWVRCISSSGFNKRDLPSTTSTPEYESKSKSASENGANLSKRRMRANGMILYVNPDHYKKRKYVPSTADTTTTITVEEKLKLMVKEAKAEEESPELSECRLTKSIFSPSLPLASPAWNK